MSPGIQEKRLPTWAEPPGTQPGFKPEPPRRWPLFVGGGVITALAVGFFVLRADAGPALEPLPAADAVPQEDDAVVEKEDPVLLELPVARRVRALTQKGEEALDRRRWSTARRQFQRALELDPEHPRAHRGLGIASARMKRYGEARAAYTRYIELDPTASDAPDVRRLLGM